MIRLRCLKCDIEAAATWWFKGEAIAPKTPAICPDCDAPMKVVLECSSCKGDSTLSIDIGSWTASVTCPDCGGTGEILEEQP